MLRLFLKIMDDMDLDELVVALKEIVEIYGEELAPYSLSLTIKLSEAFERAVQTEDGAAEDEVIG